MSEIYDEIVFMNPGVVFFRECLLQYSDKTIGGTANNSASSSVTKEAPASVVSGPPNKKTKHSQASTPAVPVVRASTILPVRAPTLLLLLFYAATLLSYLLLHRSIGP